MEKIYILNFNHTYEKQDFYKDKNYEIVDLCDLKNVSRYCDDESLDVIRRRINKFQDCKIKFIDSGNYHYISYLNLEKIKEPFILVLFDHHTDMQPSVFSELMSCGSWVKKTLDDNKFIEKVIIIGAKENLINSIEEKYKDRVVCFSEEYINENLYWEKFAKEHIDKPIYISIDKDVINCEEAKTDWDQGNLTLEELRQIYINICKNQKIIGVDICGDSSRDNEFFNINKINNKGNKKILDMILESNVVENKVLSKA